MMGITVCFCVYVQPLFTMSVQQQSIKPFTEAEYNQLTKTFGDNAVRTDFSLIFVSVAVCLSCCLSTVACMSNHQTGSW